jgi:hypothetical protein
MPLALAIGGTAVGRAAYSQPAQAMIRAAMNAGPGRQAAADIVRRYGPLAAAMTTSNVNH